ncbi:MAG: phage terminase small subunit P27 family [Afipia sp.]
MRGRKPELKVIEGGMAKRPGVPDWMAKEAKAEWRRVTPKLIARKVLTQSDLGSLENYCVAIGQVRECQSTLNKDGLYVQSEKGAPRPHPAVRIMHQAMTQARQLAAELGLTPASRGKTQENDPKENEDEWAKMDL